MAYRIISYENKVKAVQECLRAKSDNIGEIAKKYGMSESTLRRERDAAINRVASIIPGGPLDELKKKAQAFTDKIMAPVIPIIGIIFGTKHTCPNCGSDHIVSNGSYFALNWLLVFLIPLFPSLSLNPREKIWRLYCKNCHNPVASKSQKTNAQIREAMKLLRARLICLLRYNGGLSIRKISFIMENAFGHSCSTGYIATLCRIVNKIAKEKMALLNSCVGKKAKVIIFDETFPCTKESSTVPLAVAIDEFGLIRAVKVIKDRKKELFPFMKSVLTQVKPLYFMSDYDKLYSKIVKKIDPAIVHCKDFVHALRTIYREARTTINHITVKTRGEMTKDRKKKITQLKKKLLRKRLYRIINRFARGFDEKNAPVGALYIEGGLEELKELAERFPSLQHFYEKTAKFVHKYIEVWAFQMELNFKEGLPATSNSLESKNSLFKVFKNNSKCFETNANTEEFYAAVALMENFSVKTRGKHKGTSAVMRAGVDPEKLGGKDFFEVVGLEEIVLGKKAKSSSQLDFGKINSILKQIVKAA